MRKVANKNVNFFIAMRKVANKNVNFFISYFLIVLFSVVVFTFFLLAGHRDTVYAVG